ncbi:hypothetical protein HDV05_004081 [Chytridiales sp. JEL 0842]|nr:hypothetical protein HDV05_004081 [Chytridiales sp. JEL 0842]
MDHIKLWWHPAKARLDIKELDAREAKLAADIDAIRNTLAQQPLGVFDTRIHDEEPAHGGEHYVDHDIEHDDEDEEEEDVEEEEEGEDGEGEEGEGEDDEEDEGEEGGGDDEMLQEGEEEDEEGDESMEEVESDF